MAKFVSTSLSLLDSHSFVQIALRLARLLAQNAYTVTSVIRDPAHAPDITALSAIPHVVSLEDSPTATFTDLFTKTRAQLVYFTAGAGGKGGDERTRAVDYEGAVKVFDAVEGMQGDKPRIILLSALDVRNPDKLETYPAHYTEDDKMNSRRVYAALGTYNKWKFEADKNLVARTAFRWTILRPGMLSDTPGTGLVEIGHTHLGTQIPVCLFIPHYVRLAYNAGMFRETTSQRRSTTLPLPLTHMASRSTLPLAARL